MTDVDGDPETAFCALEYTIRTKLVDKMCRRVLQTSKRSEEWVRWMNSLASHAQETKRFVESDLQLVREGLEFCATSPPNEEGGSSHTDNNRGGSTNIKEAAVGISGSMIIDLGQVITERKLQLETLRAEVQRLRGLLRERRQEQWDKINDTLKRRKLNAQIQEDLMSVDPEAAAAVMEGSEVEQDTPRLLFVKQLRKAITHADSLSQQQVPRPYSEQDAALIARITAMTQKIKSS